MVRAYLHQTDVIVHKHKLRINAYYSDDWNASGIALLGQNSFFTRFDVLFSRKDREFTLLFKG